MASLKSALVAALSILLLGIAPVLLTPAPASAACVTTNQQPCHTARQYRAAFKRGDLGRSHVRKSKWPLAFKRKLHKVVVRKGLVPPANASARQIARSNFRYVDWHKYWDAFNNAVDCVAPGAESSCKDDFDKIKPLKKPGKIAVGCGGMAIAAFYTAGGSIPATAAVGGGLTCGWGVAIAAW